jgi:hypothetical protein
MFACLFSNAGNSSGELETKLSWPSLGFHPGINLDELRKTTHLSADGQFPGRELKQACEPLDRSVRCLTFV